MTVAPEHPPIDPGGWALEYSCGCVREWCADEWVAGLFLTTPCEKHAVRMGVE